MTDDDLARALRRVEQLEGLVLWLLHWHGTVNLHDLSIYWGELEREVWAIAKAAGRELPIGGDIIEALLTMKAIHPNPTEDVEL